MGPIDALNEDARPGAVGALGREDLVCHNVELSENSLQELHGLVSLRSPSSPPETGVERFLVRLDLGPAPMI